MSLGPQLGQRGASDICTSPVSLARFVESHAFFQVFLRNICCSFLTVILNVDIDSLQRFREHNSMSEFHF